MQSCQSCAQNISNMHFFILKVQLTRTKSWSYGNGIRIEASAQITTAQARELAAALIEYADREDAKVAADKAREDRRKAWRDREVAAGRMKVFTMKEFLGHG